MPFGSDDDIEVIVGGPDGMLRYFDRDASGAVDPTLLAKAKAHARATIRTELRDSHPALDLDALDPAGDDYAVLVHAWARLVVAFAENITLARRMSARPKDAVDFRATALADLERLSRNAGTQLSSGAPAPFAQGGTFVTAPPTPFNAAAGSGGASSSSDAGQVYSTPSGGFWHRDGNGGGGWSGF